jgi:hypothetical protein
MPAAAIEIQPVEHRIDTVVAVPGSKSFTNRALLVAALAEGQSTLSGALFSDDTHYMSEALRALGVEVRADRAANRFEVAGNGGRIPVERATLYIGNAGTAARSLVSYVALGHGTFVIDGDEPMRRTRPISDLLAALRKLGVDARSQSDNGCLPVVVNARGVQGGRTQLDASKSSQFLTSLMLAAPYMERGLTIEMLKPFKTAYIDITTAVGFGAGRHPLRRRAGEHGLHGAARRRWNRSHRSAGAARHRRRHAGDFGHLPHARRDRAVRDQPGVDPQHRARALAGDGSDRGGRDRAAQARRRRNATTA